MHHLKDKIGEGVREGLKHFGGNFAAAAPSTFVCVHKGVGASLTLTAAGQTTEQDKPKESRFVATRIFMALTWP